MFPRPVDVELVFREEFRFVQWCDLRREGHCLGLHTGIDVHIGCKDDRLLDGMPDDGLAMATHQHDRIVAERLRQGRATGRIRDLQAAAAFLAHVAEFEGRRLEWQEARLGDDRPQLERREAERDDSLRMGMDDGLHIRPRLVDLAMDVALAVDTAALGVNRLAVRDIHLKDVRLRHECGRHGLGHQENVGVLVRAGAHMAEAVENAFVHEDLVGGDDVLLEDVIGVGGLLSDRAIRQGKAEGAHHDIRNARLRLRPRADRSRRIWIEQRAFRQDDVDRRIASFVVRNFVPGIEENLERRIDG